MDFKTVILVIILAIMVGIGIFFGQRILAGDNSSANPFKVSDNLTTQAQKTPEPKPTPSFPPLTSTSNLETETEKLNPPDFSGEYKNLQGEVQGK